MLQSSVRSAHLEQLHTGSTRYQCLNIDINFAQACGHARLRRNHMRGALLPAAVVNTVRNKYMYAQFGIHSMQH